MTFSSSIMFIHQRGIGKGGAGGALPPPLFFARDDNFLSTAVPLHT